MRIGFIGAGGITRPYRNSLRQMADARVVGVYDVDRDRARAVAEEEGGQVYDGELALLDQAELDAVFVCLPPGAHRRQVIDAAERGLAVFVAKPVALTLDVARDTAAAIARAGVINQSGYMWRSSDVTAKARELIGDRVLGLGVGQVLVGTPGTPWWRVKAQSGGQVLEQATHVVDLMRYFLGDVTEVQAMGLSGLMPEVTDFEDATVGCLKFAGGAVGSLATTHTGGIGRYDLGLGGRDLFVDLAVSASALTARIDGEMIEYKGTESGLHRQIEIFVEAVRNKDQGLVPTDYLDAAKTLAATVAYNQAMAGGRPVAVEDLG